MNTEQRLSMILVFLIIVTLMRLFAPVKQTWQLATGGIALAAGLWAAVIDYKGEDE